MKRLYVTLRWFFILVGRYDPGGGSRYTIREAWNLAVVFEQIGLPF